MASTSSSVGLVRGHVSRPTHVASCWRRAACPYMLRGRCWFGHDDLEGDPPCRDVAATSCRVDAATASHGLAGRVRRLERFVEQVGGVREPQILKGDVDGFVGEQIAAVPVPQIWEPIGEVVQLSQRERVQNRMPEQVVDLPSDYGGGFTEWIMDSTMPQIMEDGLPAVPQECVQNRTPETWKLCMIHHRNACKLARWSRLRHSLCLRSRRSQCLIVRRSSLWTSLCLRTWKLMRVVCVIYPWSACSIIPSCVRSASSWISCHCTRLRSRTRGKCSLWIFVIIVMTRLSRTVLGSSGVWTSTTCLDLETWWCHRPRSTSSGLIGNLRLLRTNLCTVSIKGTRAAAAVPSSNVELWAFSRVGLDVPVFVLVSFGVVAVLRQGTSLLGLLAGTLDILSWAPFWQFLLRSLRVSLGGFGCVHSSGWSCLTADIYSSSACWRLWKNFIFLYVVWQIRILKSASLFLWPCSSSNGGGMHSAGYACFGALHAMFLSCRQKWPCSSSTMAVECILLVLLVFMHLALCPWRLPAEVPRSLSTLAVVFSHFALRSRRLPAGVSMCSLLCTSWFMAWWKLWRSRSCCSPWVVQLLDKVVDVPVVFTTGAVFRHGCWYARCVQRHGSWSRQCSSWTRSLLCPLFLRQVHMVPDVQKTFGGAADAVLRCWGRPCDHAALMWCVWRWGCSGFFFAVFVRLFSASSSELRPCQFILRCCGYTHSLICHWTTTTIIQSGEAPFKQASSLHPTLGSWSMLSSKQAAQPNPSYPALCRQDTTSPWSTDYGGNR